MTLWAVVVVDEDCRRIAIKASKKACKAFMKDNSYLYPKMRLVLAHYGNCKLI